MYRQVDVDHPSEDCNVKLVKAETSTRRKHNVEVEDEAKHKVNTESSLVMAGTSTRRKCNVEVGVEARHKVNTEKFYCKTVKTGGRFSEEQRRHPGLTCWDTKVLQIKRR